METVQLPYGMEVGTHRMVHVSAVPSGLSELVCPKCRDRLIAARGAILAHHFRHHGERDCVGALEHVLHLTAKQIIADARRVMLPAVHAWSGAVRRLEAPPAWCALHGVQLEARRPGYVPDVLAGMPDGRHINLEIRYSHAVDAAKLAKLAQDNIHAVEIIITGFAGNVSDAAFRNFVLANAPRLWLHNPDQDLHNTALSTELALAEAERQRLWDLEAAERERLAVIAASNYACQQADILLDTQAHARTAAANGIVYAISHEAHRAEIAASHAIDGAQRALALAEAQAQRLATQEQAAQFRLEQQQANLVAREQARADLLGSVITWATDYYPSRDKPALAWQTFALVQQEIATIFGRLPHRAAQLALMDQSWWRENVPASLAKTTWDQLEYTR